jgi:hypothetical protein
MRRKYLRAPAALLLAGLAVVFAPAYAAASAHDAHLLRQGDFEHALAHHQQAAWHEQSLHREESANEAEHMIAAQHNDGVEATEHSDGTVATEHADGIAATEHADATTDAEVDGAQHAHVDAAHVDEAGAHAHESAAVNHLGDSAACHQHAA